MLSGDVDVTFLRRVAVLPVNRFAGRIDIAFQLTDRLRQHCGVEFLVDDEIAPLVRFQERRRETVVTEASAAFPSRFFGDAAGVRVIDDFLQARNDVGVTLLAEFDKNPTPAHFMRYGSRGAGTR